MFSPTGFKDRLTEDNISQIIEKLQNTFSSGEIRLKDQKDLILRISSSFTQKKVTRKQFHFLLKKNTAGNLKSTA